MAFLDNSGDIILDAVLTDTGRLRLARGDGSFKVTKFALGDDEINYETYNAQHPSGSAFFDLEILQTPIFEAFTNNTATMKSKLVSLTNNNLLYLPIIKLNTEDASAKPTDNTTTGISSGSHVILVDTDTVTEYNGVVTNNANRFGVINGTAATSNGNFIRTDQGLDTTEISPDFILDPELKETQYIIEIDSRFAKIYSRSNTSVLTPSFVDDDLVASYYVTSNTAGDMVVDSVTGNADANQGSVRNAAVAGNETIAGPRGTSLSFGLLASTDLVSSNFLFDTLGTTSANFCTGKTFKQIDTFARVTGATTGFRIDIPLRFLKLQ